MKIPSIIAAGILTFSFCMSATPAIAGQEISGGDLYSLMFVKIGRTLLDEMQTNKSCEIGKAISLREFRKNLDQIEIETGDRPSRTKNHHILDRADWMFQPMQEKIRAVLTVYSGKNMAALSTQTIDQCRKSVLWKKVDIEGLYDREKMPEVNVERDAENTSVQLMALFHSQEYKSLLSSVQLQKLEDLAKHAQFSTSPIPIPFFKNTFKDGVNDRSNRQARIQLDEANWIALNSGQKMELLFHEYLGLLGIDDLKYRYSSRIFLKADEKLYRT